MRFLARMVLHAVVVVAVLGTTFALFSHIHLTLDHAASHLVALEPSDEPAEPLDWTPDNPNRVRILAIDGGGTLGLSMLETLSAIEHRTGQPISESFDLFVGTSTGALIAVLLNIPGTDGTPKYSVDEIIELYQTIPPKIFSAPPAHTIATLDGLIGPRFPNQPRIAQIREVFESLRFGDLLNPVAILSFSQKTNDIRRFSNLHAQDAELRVGPVIAAVTSAPIMFAAVTLSGTEELEGYYLDAAFLVTNPSLFAFEQARRRSPDARLVLVSVGTETTDETISPMVAEGGAATWAIPLIALSMTYQEKHITRQLTSILGKNDAQNVEVHRIAPPVPASTNQFSGSPELLDLIRQIGRQYVSDNQGEIQTVVEALGYPVTPATPSAATAAHHDQPGKQPLTAKPERP